NNIFGFSENYLINIFSPKIELSPLIYSALMNPLNRKFENKYKFCYKDSYNVNGFKVYRIEFIPINNAEPSFWGEIDFIDSFEVEDKIFHIDYFISKSQGLQFFDTLEMQQLFTNQYNKWALKQQNIIVASRVLGLNFSGEINFNYKPIIPDSAKKKYVVKQALDSAFKELNNHDSMLYNRFKTDLAWDVNRKDSLARIDMINMENRFKNQNKIKPIFPFELMFTGKFFYLPKYNIKIKLESFIHDFDINPIEGFKTGFKYQFIKDFSNCKQLLIEPYFRYGFNNGIFNPSVGISYKFRQVYQRELYVNFGQRIIQFNNKNPVNERANDLYYLFNHTSYLRIYKSQFFYTKYALELNHGLSVTGGFLFENRFLLNNLTYFPLIGSSPRINPNRPVNNTHSSRFAVIIDAQIQWRIKCKYQQIGNNKFSIGSDYPIVTLHLYQGVPSLLNSDINYNKWSLNTFYFLQLKSAGAFKFDYTIGGFINRNNVGFVDYNHYLTNEFILSNYAFNSFQALPFYLLSNKERFYLSSFNEYKLQGNISNKI
ncbi:MAG: DUF5686 family protein, partial [Sediminibacterium sp.]|nr:DUF5686 family protein [Sediminibacterium sp.]